MGLFSKKPKYLGKIPYQDVTRIVGGAKSGDEFHIVEAAGRTSQAKFEHDISEIIYKNNLMQIGAIENDGISIWVKVKVN
ncbi:MAG: hypothetical protein K5656_07690 [Lachnospiraceae bacterium]|nr:hypothetical protein [Lachnospiraceae bacterium]